MATLTVGFPQTALVAPPIPIHLPALVLAEPSQSLTLPGAAIMETPLPRGPLPIALLAPTVSNSPPLPRLTRPPPTQEMPLPDGRISEPSLTQPPILPSSHP